MLFISLATVRAGLCRSLHVATAARPCARHRPASSHRKPGSDLGAKRFIMLGTIRQSRRIGARGEMVIIGGRGDRQCLADRFDPMRTAMVVNELDHHFDRWSNSHCPLGECGHSPRGQSQNTRSPVGLNQWRLHWLTLAKVLIRLGRSSRFSRSKAFIRSTISLETLGRLPRLTAAILTQSFRVWGAQPIFAAIDMIACQRDPC